MSSYFLNGLKLKAYWLLSKMCDQSRQISNSTNKDQIRSLYHDRGRCL